jgi:GNAT superfamily N-acetyltransferase
LIRAYRASDRDAVLALVRDVLVEHGFEANVGGVERDLADVASGYRGKRAGFWVDEIDGVIAGTVAVRPKEGATCELKRLYVAKTARGRGVGRALYAHAEAFARAAGYERIWLDSSRRFASARRLYEGNGFVLREELDNDWCDNVYEKILTPLALNPPYNWCDRRCERCPLTPTCALQKRELQRAWVHAARGEDPTDPDVLSADFEEDLARAERLVMEAAREEGLDLDAPSPPEVALLDRERLRRATRTIVGALPSAMPFVQKCARVIGADTADAELWAFDVAPNLLVIERLRAELAPEIERADENVRAAIAVVDRMFAPLLAAVSSDARRRIEALVATKAAPSPFSVLPSSKP